MKDFAAIDFETANGKRTSVCSVGVVVVRGGEVVDTFYRLIRPRPNFYSHFTTAIHGLRYEDTADAPDFASVWREIEPRIEGLPLVAHNSPFDEGCLRAVFELYGMPWPGYTFYCTCRASRRTFGSRLPNHQLHTVSAACGFFHGICPAQSVPFFRSQLVKRQYVYLAGIYFLRQTGRSRKILRCIINAWNQRNTDDDLFFYRP